MLIVAIDGPAGAGKSTVAKALAERLGIEYLDTGAMYRAVTWAALRDDVDLHDVAAIGALAESVGIELTSDSVRVGEHDVTSAIRSTEVTAAVSIVAANSRVRSEMRNRQRQWGEQRGGGVIEGRDIGTVVFPDATLKLFLTASPRLRAERRVAQNGGDIDTIERSIIERDRLDSTRTDSPLAESSDAILVDTSHRSVEEVVESILGLLESRR